MGARKSFGRRSPAPAPFDLAGTFVHLEDGPRALPVEVTADLWERVEASPTLSDGRMVGLNRAREPDDLHPSEWERHPAGEELVCLLSGEVDLILDEAAGERCVELREGTGFIVPRGVWHRFVRRGPCDVLFVVRGAGTELRPV
jgi:mannose-6-phosphate isomerase-like protein (cupin superfamily)